MPAAAPRLPSSCSTLLGAPRYGSLRGAWRPGRCVRISPRGAAFPVRAFAPANHYPHLRSRLLHAPLGLRRRMVLPARSPATRTTSASAPRRPRKVRNLSAKIRQSCLSPARPPLGAGLARDSSPLHPRPLPACLRSARLSPPPRSGTVRGCLPTGCPV